MILATAAETTTPYDWHPMLYIGGAVLVALGIVVGYVSGRQERDEEKHKLRDLEQSNAFNRMAFHEEEKRSDRLYKRVAQLERELRAERQKARDATTIAATRHIAAARGADAVAEQLRSI